MSLFLSNGVSLMNFKKKSRCNLNMNMQIIFYSLSLKMSFVSLSFQSQHILDSSRCISHFRTTVVVTKSHKSTPHSSIAKISYVARTIVKTRWFDSILNISQFNWFTAFWYIWIQEKASWSVNVEWIVVKFYMIHKMNVYRIVSLHVHDKHRVSRVYPSLLTTKTSHFSLPLVQSCPQCHAVR